MKSSSCSSASTRRTTRGRRTTRCLTGKGGTERGTREQLVEGRAHPRARGGGEGGNRAAAPPPPPTHADALRLLTPRSLPFSSPHSTPLSKTHSQQLNKDTRQLSVDLVDVKMFDGRLGATLEERPADLLPLVRV